MHPAAPARPLGPELRVPLPPRFLRLLEARALAVGAGDPEAYAAVLLARLLVPNPQERELLARLDRRELERDQHRQPALPFEGGRP